MFHMLSPLVLWTDQNLLLYKPCFLTPEYYEQPHPESKKKIYKENAVNQFDWLSANKIL